MCVYSVYVEWCLWALHRQALRSKTACPFRAHWLANGSNSRGGRSKSKLTSKRLSAASVEKQNAAVFVLIWPDIVNKQQKQAMSTTTMALALVNHAACGDRNARQTANIGVVLLFAEKWHHFFRSGATDKTIFLWQAALLYVECFEFMIHTHTSCRGEVEYWKLRNMQMRSTAFANSSNIIWQADIYRGRERESASEEKIFLFIKYLC